MQIDQEKYLIELSQRKAANQKVEYEYQALGKEMQVYFPKAQRGWLWSLFWKYPENQMRDAFKVCRERGIYDVKYLKGILNNK